MGSGGSRIQGFSFTEVLQRALEERAILDQISEWVHSSKSISIFLTGKTGSGKSTLVNAIVGKSVAEEGEDPDPMTAEVKCYEHERDGITLKVWDSPGLQDGTDQEERYIADMKAKCTEVDLYLLCINVYESVRFNRDNREIEAIKKLTETFGSSMWENTVVALTFANQIEDKNQPMTEAKRRISRIQHQISAGEGGKKESEEMKAAQQVLEEEKGKLEKLFCEKIQEWDEKLREMLKSEVNVNPSLVEKLKIIPTGYREPTSLPDRPHWLSTFWFSVLTSTHRRAQPALLHLNRNRVVENIDAISDSDLEKHVQDQALIFTERGAEFGGNWGNSTRGLFVGLKVAHMASVSLVEQILVDRFLKLMVPDETSETEGEGSQCGGPF